MRLLVIDDDIVFAKTMAKLLIDRNYVVDIATDGQTGWQFVQSWTYDLIVLDVMLPKLDGVSLCQQLRQSGDRTPILLLTARDSSSDKIAGLDAGADDYMIKPFDWQELLARIRALLRRERVFVPSVLTWGALSLNSQTCEVSYAGEVLALRPKEYQLLELFLRNPSRVFSCGAILEHLWSFEDLPSEDVVRAHIKGLRQKLKQVEPEEIVETIYGMGYRLKPIEDSLLATNSSLSPEVIGELQQALTVAWEEVKPEILEQIAFLEEIVKEIAAGSSEPQLRQSAIAEAHKLIGTVGTYGFNQAAEQAAQIEAILQGDRPFDPQTFARLQQQVTALRQELLSVAVSLNQPATAQTSLLSPKPTDSSKVLAVDDDPHFLATLKTVLNPWGFNLTTLGVNPQNHDSFPQQFWDCLDKIAPDLLLLDVRMPEISGLEICEQIRNDSRWAGLPIVFLTAYTDTETIQRVFSAGADDFVSKPIVGPELIARIVTRLERNRFWQRLTEQDELTQLPNRLKFTQNFRQLLQQAQQQNRSISLAILSVESLKFINHEYSYQEGDRLLHQIGAALKRIQRGEEQNSIALVARWSSNKFAIALFDLELMEAQDYLSRLIQSLSQEEIVVENNFPFPLETRTAIAQYPQDGPNLQALYRTVEIALAQT